MFHIDSIREGIAFPVEVIYVAQLSILFLDLAIAFRQ